MLVPAGRASINPSYSGFFLFAILSFHVSAWLRGSCENQYPAHSFPCDRHAAVRDHPMTFGAAGVQDHRRRRRNVSTALDGCHCEFLPLLYIQYHLFCWKLCIARWFRVHLPCAASVSWMPILILPIFMSISFSFSFSHLLMRSALSFPALP